MNKFILPVTTLAIVAVLVGSCINYLFPPELKALNREREAAFRDIRPALLKYKAAKGKFPCALAELVPDYAAAVPGVLLPDETNTGVFSLTYSGCSGKSAYFIYHTTRGPDSRREYHVATGTFVDDL